MAANGSGDNGGSNPLSTPPPQIRTASTLLSPSALARVRLASIQQQQSSTPPSATFATDDIRITAPNVELAPPSLRKDCVLFYYPVRFWMTMIDASISTPQPQPTAETDMRNKTRPQLPDTPL